jgi:hypothetical protein
MIVKLQIRAKARIAILPKPAMCCNPIGASPAEAIFKDRPLTTGDIRYSLKEEF